MGLLDSLKGLLGKSKDVIDTNSDGQINTADLGNAVSNIQDAAGNLGEAVQNIADANGDGQVNLGDAGAAVDSVKQAAGDTAATVGDAVNQVKDQLPK